MRRTIVCRRSQAALSPLSDQLGYIEIQIASLDRQLLEWRRSSSVSQRLASIPGVGPVAATALAASVTEPAMFASGREFSASWV
ncbi:hypothetical protein C5708_03160 [Caulobacter sp. CCUG 60055]|nr:hypothetical protein [Caulobacter sp. CCUG 60055]